MTAFVSLRPAGALFTALALSIVMVGCSGTADERSIERATTCGFSAEELRRSPHFQIASSVLAQSLALDVEFDRPAIDIPPDATIDIEWGSGHGGDLEFVRLSGDGASTLCERISWNEPDPDKATPLVSVARAHVPSEQVAEIRELVKALSTATVTKRLNADRFDSFSSNDFYSLIRVSGGTDEATSGSAVWRHCGYASSESIVRYAALEGAVTRARELLEPLPWTPVAIDEYRRTHFSDAFLRNRLLDADPSSWWVRERSVKALGAFGDRSVLPALREMLEPPAAPTERQIAALRRILSEPGRFLDGPPQRVDPE